MAEAQAPAPEVQTPETQVPQSNPTAGKELCRAAVIGFARNNCKRCFGRGRIGFDVRYHDNLHVIICPCVEIMDLDAVQASWEKHKHAEKQTTAATSQTDPGVESGVPASDEGTGEAVGTEAAEGR